MKLITTLFRRSIERFSGDQCSNMAAAISYYVLFSVIPLAVLSVAIFGFVITDRVCGRGQLIGW